MKDGGAHPVQVDAPERWGASLHVSDGVARSIGLSRARIAPARQGSSPAKRAVCTMSSWAHGHHCRPSTHCSKWSDQALGTVFTRWYPA